jgi:hypothetical protein
MPRRPHWTIALVIRTSPGKTVEIEVDAVTGKLAGEEEVLYRIGN